MSPRITDDAQEFWRTLKQIIYAFKVRLSGIFNFFLTKTSQHLAAETFIILH